MYKKIIYILSLIFFITSCDTLSSVKKGLTGEKENSIDEFLIKRKDPLILPPDFENLASPDDNIVDTEEISAFEKNLETAIKDNSSSSSSVEDSILKRIRSK